MRMNFRRTGAALAVAVGLLGVALAAPAQADSGLGTEGTRVTSVRPDGTRVTREANVLVDSSQAEVDSRGRSTKDGITIMAAGQIGSGIGSCPAGWFCVWFGYEYTNSGYGWSGSDANWADNYFANGLGSVNNNAGSWYNKGNVCSGCSAVRIFDGANFGAPRLDCRPRLTGDPVADFRGSSHSWFAGC